MNWEVLFYTKANGRMVVDEFIQSLDRTAKAKTVHLIDLLARYGTDLGMPHTKTLGGGLLELRVHGKHEVRIFYIFAPWFYQKDTSNTYKRAQYCPQTTKRN